MLFNQAERMRNLVPGIFNQIDDLRKAEMAAGRDVVTLSIGSPDLAPAAHIIDALTEAVKNNHNYGYTLSKGAPQLLAAIADWYKIKFNIILNPAAEIHSLLGSQEGLAHIALCLVNPGDTVLVPDPGYPIFSAGPLIAGADIHYLPLLPENNYLPDLDAIDPSLWSKTKLMILNYPNNPLAATATKSFFAKVVNLAQKYSFIVCHDFAYSELVFDGYRPDSFLSVPGAREVGIEFHSLSKTYSLAGCRVGFVVGNAKIIELLGRLKSNFDYGIFYPLQQAAIAALTGPQQCVLDTAATYQKRRDIIVDGFNALGWPVNRPKASMYVWAPVPTNQKSFAFTTDLLKQAGVAVVPGVAFGQHGEHFIRIALVEPEDRLQEAVYRIGKWLG